MQHMQQAAAYSQPQGSTSPICRCRVMYLGSSVPHITKDGLQGIQEPLRELYPDEATLAAGNAGIDSWLSVWSNGILIENVDETGREIKRFFKIDALHYCAAVKYVNIQSNGQVYGTPSDSAKFLPLDSPHVARQLDTSNPPIFASILRRTTGIKVLECHAFICKREAAANALVRCCFHAYADTMYAKQIGADINAISTASNNNNNNQAHQQAHPIASRRSKSIAALNEPDNNNNTRLEAWRNSDTSANSQYGDNHQQHQHQRMVRRKSINEPHYATNNCDNDDDTYRASNKHQQQQQQIYNEPLKMQQKLSKSLYQLNNVDQQQLIHDNNQFPQNQQPFFVPQAGRVPSYPPQSLIDATNNGGTLKSIKSMAANSIASTLLRSKKHAKAMSMAQLNQQQQQQQQQYQMQNFDKIISFHQPHLAHNISAATIGPSGFHPMATLPPIPPMFLQNLPPNHPMCLMNGSQTMKLPSSRSMVPLVGPPRNFESMTPKEMKKLLKKSAKYGIDPSKLGDTLFPQHLRPPVPPHMQLGPNQQLLYPPPPSKSGTMVSQSTFSEIYGAVGNGGIGEPGDVTLNNGLHRANLMMPPPPSLMDPLDPFNQHQQQQMKPILVKPNPEFLKSKAGKKWVKQQKEFKKLLPPHLDGLPIIFGPPPPEALEPAIPSNFISPPPLPPPHGLPMLDSNGYYNPHPFYGQNGRASAASTLLRYSPSMQSQLHHHQHPDDMDHHQRHMVEQSIISLGDENDHDDEVDEELEHQRHNNNTSCRRQC